MVKASFPNYELDKRFGTSRLKVLAGASRAYKTFY